MAYVMGIDLGTSSVKTVIFDTEGRVRGSAQQEYQVLIKQPGWAEQDAEKLWTASADTIRTALHRSGIAAEDIDGIGFSGQMHGLVSLDCNMQPLRNIIIWMDQRSGRETEQIEALNRRETLLNAAATGFYGTSLLWLKNQEPDCYENLYKAVLPKDYIRLRICGEIGTDITDAAGTGLFDIPNERWAWDVIRELGLRNDILPEAGKPWRTAGTVSRECAAQTGLAAGTPVVFGGGDQAMHSVGNGMVKNGILTTNIGTAGQVSCAVDRAVYDPQFRTNTFGHAVDGLWSLVGATLNGGSALKWLRENILHISDYQAINTKAASVVSGSAGMIFLPYLCGERSPHMNPDAKGMFFGLTPGMSDAHMLRSVMEGVIYSFKDCLGVFEELGIRCDKVIASGGGARSEVWLQIQSDILEKEIHTTQTEEEACLGAAIMAGVGTGVYKSVEEACELLVREAEKIYIPQEQNFRVYREGYEIFRQLYINNRDLF